ncbi:MAG TPA: tetratricopeptide repeat protein [Pyrinomonadaceae bacterium]|jgi:tetratricopeptide (TPR) repeat protein
MKTVHRRGAGARPAEARRFRPRPRASARDAFTRSLANAFALLCLVLAAAGGAAAQAGDRVGKLERAASLIVGGRLEEAERQLNEVLKGEPEDAQALNMLGALRAKQGRLDEAEALLARAVGRDGGMTSARMNLAHLRLLKGEPEKAAAELREVLRLEPSNAEAGHRLAWLLLRQGKLDECIALAESLRGTRGASAPLLAVLGEARLKKGDARAAVSAFERAVELDPAEPAYHFALGSAWLRQERPDLDAAEPSFRRFLKLRPDDAQGQLHLGYVLLKQKRHAEARQWLEKLVRADRATPEAFYYLGLIAQGENDDARAVELFGRSIQLAPTFYHAHVALGATHLKLKDYERARLSLEAGVRLSPEEPKAHYNLALLYARLKQPERAREEMSIVERLKGEGKTRAGDGDEDNVAPPPPR